MANDINRVVLVGRLTADPELRKTQGGTSIASFSLANNRSFGSGGDKKEQVSFFSCVAWGKPGEVIAEHAKKGQMLSIDGRLQQRSWQDKDGGKRSTVEIVVENFQFLSQKKEGGGASTSPPDSSAQYEEPEYIPPSRGASSGPSHFSDEDIPF